MTLKTKAQLLARIQELQQQITDLATEQTANFGVAKKRLPLELNQTSPTEELARQFGDILDKSLNEIFIFDIKDFKFLHANEGALRNLGYTLEELKQLTPLDIKPEFNKKKFKKLVSPLLSGEEEIVRFTTTHQRKDGSAYPVEVNLQQTVYGSKQVFLAVIMDITERKKLQEKLEASENQFRDYFENAPNAYFSIDADGNILSCNKRAKTLLGYGDENLVGKPVFNLYADTLDGKEKAAKVLQRFRAGETVNNEELQMQRKDGSPVWIGLTVNAIRDNKGQIVASRSMAVDISEQKRLTDVLQEKDEMLHIFVENTPAAVAMFDREMKYLAASRRFRVDYRLGGQNLIGRSHYEVFPEVPDRWKEIHQRCLAGAVETCEQDPFPRADGSLDWIRWEIHPWHLANGKIGGIILISDVITEQIQTKENLKKSNRLYAVLSQVNIAIARERDKQKLFQKICNTAIEFGKFKLAWIGLVDDENKSVLPVAFSGEGSEYLSNIRISLTDGISAKGPTGRSIHEEKCIVFNDLENNPDFEPWRKQALEKGYRSSGSFPIQVNKNVIGSLNIYAVEPQFFNKDEIKLLEEVALNISFALEKFEEEEKRKQAEYALSETTKIINRSPMVAFLWGNEEGWPVEFVSENAKKLFGYSAQEFLEGQITYPKIIHSDDLERVAGEVESNSKNEGAQSFTHAPYRIVTKSGEVKWIEDITHIRRDARKIITHYEGIVYDITERIETEDIIKKQSENLTSLLEISQTLTSTLDKENILQTIIESATNLFGLDSGAIYEMKGEELYLAATTPPLPPNFPNEFRHASLADHPHIHESVSTGLAVILPDADTADLSPAEREISDTRGLRSILYLPLMINKQAIGILIMGTIGKTRSFSQEEITMYSSLASQAALSLENVNLYKNIKNNAAELEQRIVERTAELAIAKEHAESADRLKSAFLATMSHELRTPLNSIIGFTGILLQNLVGPLNEEQNKQLKMVQGSAHHLLDLINDVLDISKIEAGQLEIVSKPFDIRQAIQTVVETIAPTAEKKELDLITSIAPQVGMITSDRRRVEQILINLLNNAVKFTERGEVRLECAIDKAWLVTQVIDNGIGIQQIDLDLLFKPFQQVDSGITRNHEGTGLGLSICKRLVEMLGGKIWVESEWGIGSTFTFTLPFKRT